MGKKIPEKKQRIIENIERYAETKFESLYLLPESDLIKIQHLAIEAKAFDEVGNE